MRHLMVGGVAAAFIVSFLIVPRAETIDRVLAVVSGNLILLSDVTAARELGLVTPPATAADPIRAVLSQLIDRALIVAEVDRYAPADIPADAIERQLGVVRQRVAPGPAFEALLARSGIDERRLREILGEEARIRAYLDQRFTSAPATEEDIVRYYNEHPAAFTGGDGRQPLDAVRQQIADVVAAERRAASRSDWIAGLRRRADIIDLYRPER